MDRRNEWNSSGKKERIDLTKFEGLAKATLTAELKRMYEEEDKLLYLIEVIFEYPHSNIAAAVAKRKASE